MGIKFRCPNGHKLNVKSFLAGKKGICPHCGVSMRIPAGEANAPDDHEGETEIETGGAATAVLTKSMADTVTLAATFAVPATSVAPLATPVVQPTPVTPSVAIPATPVISAHVAAAPVMAVAAPVAPALAMPTIPLGTAAPVATPMGMPPMGAPLAPSPYAIMPTAPVDPINEAPNAVWYVRPPSGGQFGPARGDIMRKWLGEGRVSADSLVWRDGWQDWKNAALVFPSLAPTGAPAATLPGEGLAVATLAKSTPSRAPRSKKSSNGLAIGMVVALGLIAVILLAVFIFVLMGMNQA